MMRVAVLDDYQGAARASDAWTALAGRAEVVFFSDSVRGRALVERLAAFDAVVLMRERTPVPRAVIEALPRLVLIVSSGRANAALDTEAACEQGIVICGTIGLAGVTATVEHTWALILAVVRGVAAEHDTIRDGGWMRGVPPQLAGRTLGVVGLGNLGRLIPPVARSLGMQVVAWSRNMTPADADAVGVRYLAYDEFFATADVVTLHLKLSDRSRHYIGEAELQAMRPGSFLVNTSRGGVLDTQALLRALDHGPLAGAALDVFDEEPLPLEHPLRRHPKCLVTPHMGYVSDASYTEYYAQIVEDLIAYLDGAPIRTW